MMTPFETISIMLTIIGCTWAVCQKIADCVTQEQCSERRARCRKEKRRRRKEVSGV